MHYKTIQSNSPEVLCSCLSVSWQVTQACIYLIGRWSRCSESPPVAKKIPQPAPEVGGDHTHAVDQPNVPACDKVLHRFNSTPHLSSIAFLFLSLTTNDLPELKEKALKWWDRRADSSFPGCGPPQTLMLHYPPQPRLAESTPHAHQHRVLKDGQFVLMTKEWQVPANGVRESSSLTLCLILVSSPVSTLPSKTMWIRCMKQTTESVINLPTQDWHWKLRELW